MSIEKTFIGSTYIMGVSPLWYDDSTPAYADPAMISQYANSPTLVRLISDMSGYINPQARFDEFIRFAWDVRTAQAWGLDILGRIVGVSRKLAIPDAGPRMGFDEGQDYQPFGQASFYRAGATVTYALDDGAYRTLILVKALLNISNSTAPAINRLLQALFFGRGRCFVADTGRMQMLLVFEFELLPYEMAILTNSTAVPRPAAVGAHVLQAQHFSDTFGFSESGQFQPFGQGAFFNQSISLTRTN